MMTYISSTFVAVVETTTVDVWAKYYEDIASSGSPSVLALCGGESRSARFDRIPRGAVQTMRRRGRQLADEINRNFYECDLHHTGSQRASVGSYPRQAHPSMRSKKQ